MSCLDVAGELTITQPPVSNCYEGRFTTSDSSFEEPDEIPTYIYVFTTCN